METDWLLVRVVTRTYLHLDMSDERHWNEVYCSRQPYEVSWTESSPSTSLSFIESFGLDAKASVIDVGGGESLLVDALLERGYDDITVLDISRQALDKTKQRLGDAGSHVKWLCTDVTQFQPQQQYDIWHDRATFHFLVEPKQIVRYLEIARNCVHGYLTIGTFSENGPAKCSGLEVKRYSEHLLETELSNGFEKMRCITADHITPFNTLQNFLFCSFKRAKQNGS